MWRRQEGEKKTTWNKTGWRMHKAEVPFKSSGEVNNFSGRQSGNSCPAATWAHSTNFPNWKEATCTLNQKQAGTSLWTKAIGENSDQTAESPWILLKGASDSDTGQTSSRALITAHIIIWLIKTLMLESPNTGPLSPFSHSSSWERFLYFLMVRKKSKNNIL